MEYIFRHILITLVLILLKFYHSYEEAHQSLDQEIPLILLQSCMVSNLLTSIPFFDKVHYRL